MQVIGKNDVAVPTHLYKVLQVDNGDMYDTTAVAAFVVPNLPIPNDHTLKQYQVLLLLLLFYITVKKKMLIKQKYQTV